MAMRSDERGGAAPARWALFAGFLFSGALTVLLGLVLPRVAALHHLTDSESGELLMTQFGACATGALFVRRRYGHTLVLGYLLIGAGAAALTAGWAAVAVAAIAVYGLGLGLAMTSTSMLIGRIYAGRRGAAFSILNLFWSCGALLCPLLVAKLQQHLSPETVYAPVAVLGVAFAALMLPGCAAVPGEGAAGTIAPPDAAYPALLVFAGISFLYVGAEATVGGWITMFAGRSIALDYARSNLVTGCFWGALLLARAATPLGLRATSEARLHLGSIVGAVAGLLLLVSAHNPDVLVAGACLTGMALGPIFPLTISLFLGKVGEARNAGWVFATAGYGGTIFPLLTGIISTGTHSLRTGLLVTLAAAGGMLVLTLQIPALGRRELKAAAIRAG